MHPGQLSVPIATVRALVRDQFPAWADLPIRAVESHGTVNALFRIGDGLTARFPLTPGDVATIRRWLESEAGAARRLLGRTRFATPEPVAVGEPGHGYPLPWAVQTWLPGRVATEDPAVSGSVPFAADLAEFIRGVRDIDTGGRTFAGSGRGGHLAAQDDWMRTCFEHSDGLLDVAGLRHAWRAMREVPRGTQPDVMNHGDRMPGTVLVDGARLAGVIDVGGLGPADPALDLVAGWHLLDERPRRVVRERLDCDDEQWARGRAWAFAQSMGLVWYYRESNPTMAAIGRRTLERLVAA
jgi:aminoglycoside phosphotransferase (APT) family kinase protein